VAAGPLQSRASRAVDELPRPPAHGHGNGRQGMAGRQRISSESARPNTGVMPTKRAADKESLRPWVGQLTDKPKPANEFVAVIFPAAAGPTRARRMAACRGNLRPPRRYPGGTCAPSCAIQTKHRPPRLITPTDFRAK
jgi:hypothetical protein